MRSLVEETEEGRIRWAERDLGTVFGIRGFGFGDIIIRCA